MWSRRRARWRRRGVPFLAILLIGGAGGAQAHPHALVVYSIVLSLPPDGVDRIGFVFTFDPLFSAVILRTAGDGDPDDVLRNHEGSLRQLPFEIEITFNGTRVAMEAPTNLQVSTEGGQITYRFAVPLRNRLLPPGTIDIGVDDPGMFVAFALRASAPVEVHASGPFAASCERVQTPTGAPGPVRCQYVEPGETAGVTP
jgi:ABC-type uncharacterized transport system substrate-binding protein